MTSNDRHASHDSPYRTGQHTLIGEAPVTTATDSRPDLLRANSKFFDDDNPLPPSPSVARRPYSPGMRSFSSLHLNQAQSPLSTASSTRKGSNETATEIPMQSFEDGAPPAPPVQRSWEQIDQWLERDFEELYDNLCEGCTINDLNELEHELDCSLPADFRESLTIHDGQERPGLPTGLIFGCMLLDCEEIVQEWNNWRKVNEEFLSSQAPLASPPLSLKPKGSPGEASSSSVPPSPTPSIGINHSQPHSMLWRQQLLDKQSSQPPRAVQKAYVHPSWIPVARDWGGNNLAIDLAPGPTGRWGQIIIFGRDFDTKYVVARSWAHFLAILADDLTSKYVELSEDSGELTFKPFQHADPPYLQILRWRTDQRCGKRSVSGSHSHSSPLARTPQSVRAEETYRDRNTDKAKV